MEIRPTLSRAKAFSSKEYKVIPISCEIFSDTITPIRVLKKLKRKSSHCYLLESAQMDQKWGRYTFLGFDPILELTCKNGEVIVKSKNQTNVSKVNPQEVIRKIIKGNMSIKFDYLPPFTGGFVGYFSYDFIKYSEPQLKFKAKDEENFKDVDLMLFDKVIAFDNYRQKIILIVNCRLDDIEGEYRRAEKELKKLKTLILEGEEIKEGAGKLLSHTRQLFNKEEYCDKVRKAKKHIVDGDIFQVVLSNRLDADFKGSLLDTYRVLRSINPSPYMFYFSGEEVEIAGASPETLVKLEDGRVYTFPLAGTRPRGATKQEDGALQKELLEDEKECAEHNMLVDLGRNDLGRISEFGSVKVQKYMDVLKFSHVMHIGSTVQGIIKNNCDAVDAISSVLPAGTLSGAPKLRACQIIDELEDNKRGIYGGAIGYIDLTGNMDTCIAIRIAYKKGGKVFVRSGAGIVADSVPENEYHECINKARAVVRALEMAQEGLNCDIDN